VKAPVTMGNRLPQRAGSLIVDIARVSSIAPSVVADLITGIHGQGQGLGMRQHPYTIALKSALFPAPVNFEEWTTEELENYVKDFHSEFTKDFAIKDEADLNEALNSCSYSTGEQLFKESERKNIKKMFNVYGID